MPLREYDCRACGHRFEWIVRLSDDDSALSCPECGTSKLERRLSAPAALVVGGGEAAPECGSSASGFG